MKSEDVRAALRTKFRAPEYALFFEVGDATGGRARRWADAVAMGLWPSRGLYLQGFEIKVSRSDWQSELKNPAKAESVARYCRHWWIVTPPGIVRDGELPDGWGLLEVHPQGVRVIKAAPVLDEQPIDKHFLAALLRRADERDRQLSRETIEKAVARDEEQTKKRIETEIEWRTRRAEDRATEAEGKIKAIYEACGLTAAEVGSLFGDSQFSAAVAMVHRLGVAKTYGGLRDIAKRLRPMADALDGLFVDGAAAESEAA